MENRKIEVLDYDRTWQNNFLAEKEILFSILKGLVVRIEHIGSTAIPGLPAKPIIDILIEMDRIEVLDSMAGDFRKCGYAVKGENGIPGRRYYQKGSNVRTHHVHAFQSGSHNLIRHMAFKEYLTAHPDIARNYAVIKKQAALDCDDDNKLYMSLKNDFITKHEPIAIEWYGERVS
ncbi:GrpB family protein [Aestuariibacter salexigens]|uniref:GrpB family protein n=1 Tax=Aestuariibacter salexigens TaxID=226010 RepID=UPI0003F67E9F|nr:GrpB family protein [Aestuariibacter salexigens]